MYRSINDYAWDFTKGHAVYFDVDSPTCFVPDEGAGVSASVPLSDPGYNGTNASITFALPSFDLSAGGSTLLGRVVSSIASGSTASLTCYFFERADHTRFDHLVVPGSRQVNHVDTFSHSDVLANTALHEWGHAMGLRHEDGFPSLMNTSPNTAGAAIVGRRLIAGPNGTSRVVVKGDGDMSQGLYALGYVPRRGNQLDYGASAVRRIVSRDASGAIVDVTFGTQSTDITIPSSGAFTLPNFSFTFFNHSRYQGGSVAFVAIPELSNLDVALKPPSLPWFDIATFPLPAAEDITAFQGGGGPWASERVGNVFFDVTLPIAPQRLAVMRSGMTPGVRYRMVMIIFPPVGLVDGDEADNFLSTGLTFRI